MNFGFLSNMNIPWFNSQSSENMASTVLSSGVGLKPNKQMASFDIKFFGWSLLSLIPWTINSKQKIQMPTTVNKELKKHAKPNYGAKSLNQYSAIRFRPYVSKVPWHTGIRAILSQVFPRYGHYCGPNWSSGKNGGSPIWDKRPIDWLDFCCYCHDIGYDTHNQAELLKADLAFLECLEKPNMSNRGDPCIANLYRTMCISGLRSVLIPYRQHLLKLQAGQLTVNFGWLDDLKLRGWNLQKDLKRDLSSFSRGWLRNMKWKGWNLDKV
ncbi:unnamed protein product [Coffea canephora]|uniref:Phospholipase A2 domain-containing protein n=2 Tax=Coffea TaxID=13442 RepID=A0A068UJM7_COFCA|nr:uncharacterized protein LOC113723775 [Coffea arabica]XP_027102558.1 uncharacterized protein LOC113723775 [Coffea arabica]XP_027102563.1 uncharacterized protein LOC113723775 [Coffea arabica]CDP08439.1 unnamed protein product [Coffea canephora]